MPRPPRLCIAVRFDTQNYRPRDSSRTLASSGHSRRCASLTVSYAIAQAFPAELVDDVEGAELSAVLGQAFDEVIGSDVIGAFKPKPDPGFARGAGRSLERTPREHRLQANGELFNGEIFNNHVRSGS